MPPTRQRVSSRVFRSSWSSSLLPLLPQPEPWGFCSPCVPRGTQGDYRAALRKVFSSLDSNERKVFRKPVTQHNEGSNPKTGRVRDTINKKDLVKRQLFVMDRQRGKSSLHGSDATATKHTSTTVTALQLHCPSGCHCGLFGFLVVFSFWLWVG